MKIIIGNDWKTVEMVKAFREYDPMKDKNLTVTEEKKSLRDIYPDMPAVKLKISEEGMESLRARAQELGGRYEPEDFEPAIISVDYSHLFRQKLNTWTYGEGYTFKDKEADLVQAYGKLYDEIVRGHESGQREIYVETPGGEERARKITLSEELACLDEAFKEYSDRLREDIAKAPEMTVLKEKQTEFLSKASESKGFHMRMSKLYSSIAEKSKEEELAKEKVKREQENRIKDETVPENIAEKMASAVQEFIAQYMGGSIKSVADILASIKMF